MINKNRSRLLGLGILISVLIIIFIGSSCSKSDIKPKYSDLQGNWKFSFVQIDTVSGTFTVSKATQQYETSGNTINVGDLYISTGTIKLGKNELIVNPEKYKLDTNIEIAQITGGLIIFKLSNFKSDNITITCNSESLYNGNEWNYYNQAITIKRY